MKRDSLRIARYPNIRVKYTFSIPRPKRMPKGYPENHLTSHRRVRDQDEQKRRTNPHVGEKRNEGQGVDQKNHIERQSLLRFSNGEDHHSHTEGKDKPEGEKGQPEEGNELADKTEIVVVLCFKLVEENKSFLPELPGQGTGVLPGDMDHFTCPER